MKIKQLNKIEWKEVELNKLKNLISRGKSPRYVKKSKIGIINQACIYWNNLKNENIKYLSEDFNLNRDLVLQKGDILINSTGTGTLGRAIVFNEEEKFTIDSHVTLFRPNAFLLDPNYFVFYLMTTKGQKDLYQKCVSGSTNQIELSKSRFESLKIPLPSLNNKPDLKTQKAIVAILEKAEQLKEKRKQTIELLDNYLKSVFNEMFGDPLANEKSWNTDVLDSVCTKITDGEHATPKLSDSGIPYLSAKNINSRIDFGDVKYVDEGTYEKITKRCLPEFNDILITCVGTIGRVKRIDIKDKFTFARSVALLKLNQEKVNPIYLEIMLSLPNMTSYMIGGTNTATVRGLYLKQIKNLKILLPPLKLQNKFASIVQHVEKLKEKQKESLEEIGQLNGVLMQKAFRGEL